MRYLWLWLTLKVITDERRQDADPNKDPPMLEIRAPTDTTL